MKVRVDIEVPDEVVNYHFKKTPKNSLRQFVYKFVHEAIELLEEEANEASKTRRNKMKCAYCHQDIQPEPRTGWDQGNNGEPLVEGRVCNNCNDLVLMERRRLMKEREKDQGGSNGECDTTSL